MLSKLPIELLEQIVQYLSTLEYRKLSVLNRKLCRILTDPETALSFLNSQTHTLEVLVDIQLSISATDCIFFILGKEVI